nr:class II fructose-bisphosphate aldolase [Armatimonas sp.]
MLLTPTQTHDLYLEALEKRFAILAVNADSPAAIVDVLEAARQCDAPVIIETSLWQLTGHSFGFGDPILGLQQYISSLRTLAASERFASTPVVFHTDHIKGPRTLDILTAAFALGASSLSLDSSELTEEANLALAQKICALGEPLALELEAGVDEGRLALWAPGCGTRHGFSEGGFPAFSAVHGSSGLPVDALKSAVAAGVVKVNWSSESLLLRSQAARTYYDLHKEQLEVGATHFKDRAMDNGVQSFVAAHYVASVAERIVLLGGQGKAARHLA